MNLQALGFKNFQGTSAAQSTIYHNQSDNSRSVQSNQSQTNPLKGSEALANYNKTFYIYSQNKELKAFEDALNSDEWEKIVNDDSVIIKQKNKLDGVIYEIAPDGTVTKSGDLVSPKVLPNTRNNLKEFYDYILWKNGK